MSAAESPAACYIKQEAASGVTVELLKSVLDICRLVRRVDHPERRTFTLVEPLKIQVTLPQGHLNDVDVVVAQPKNVSMRIDPAGRESRADTVKVVCLECRFL